MGLDITSYRNIKKESVKGYCDEDGYSNDWTEFFTHHSPDYFQHLGIDSQYWYSYEDCIRMRAGSYSGYSTWREKLSVFAQTLPRDSEGYIPFYELIMYSDCEGVIGTECSIKLANDFKTYDIDACSMLDEYSYRKYKEWREMFEFASENGAVKFH